MGEVNQNQRRNSDVFGPVVRPLTKPSYVLRMAMHGRFPMWKRSAQVKHLRIMRAALVESLAAADRALSVLDEEQA